MNYFQIPKTNLKASRLALGYLFASFVLSFGSLSFQF